jgi:hypothetical protein
VIGLAHGSSIRRDAARVLSAGGLRRPCP